MTEKKKPVVVGIGEILWDMLPGGRRAGGAPINFVYHAAAMGAEGYAISAVGNDPDGDEILRELNQNGIAHLIARAERFWSNSKTASLLIPLSKTSPGTTFRANAGLWKSCAAQTPSVTERSLQEPLSAAEASSACLNRRRPRLSNSLTSTCADAITMPG